MKITILPSFWVSAFLLAFLSTSSPLGIFFWVGVIFVSVLVHESGHAVVSRFWKQPVRIELGAFGGATIREGVAHLAPLKEFLIVMMGPLFGFAFAVFAWLFSFFLPALPPVAHESLMLISRANIFWSLLNLCPVFPLDGGRMMAIIFENIFGKKGLQASYIFSALFGLFLAIFCIGYNQVFPGVLFLMFAFESFRGFQDTKFLVYDDADKKIIDEMQNAEDEWLAKHPEQAISRLENLCLTADNKAIALQAVEQLGNYLLLTEQPKRACYWLQPNEKVLSPQGLQLLQMAFYRSQEYLQALRVGEKAFLETSNAECALINAFSATYLHKVAAAVNWLQSVKRAATLDMGDVLSSEELDPIRHEPLFKQFFANQKS
ncbi:MAG: hypothetical protein JWO53_1049 [Chlamydiia bacterium]|nr:hypothetical protein [Chlamydiia bacterium]